jgi:galactofuranose transport system ATP-binding protein
VDDLAKDGLAVVLISSEIEEVIEGSDRVVALKDGAVVGLLSGNDVTEGNVMEMLAESGSPGSGEATDGSPENGGRK